MPLSQVLHDLALSEDERKLRDGIFNLNTRRFGKVAEFMIAKLFNYELVSGQTNYDLTDQNGVKIEVKFSRVEYTEDDMDFNNCRKICIENANPVSRRIGYMDFVKSGNMEFDRNIEQIKAYEFDKMYYGLFFEDQIAIFLISSDELKDRMTAQFFVSPQKSPKPCVEKTVEFVLNNPNSARKIKDSVIKVKSKLQEIAETNNRYADTAKEYIASNSMITPWQNMIIDLETSGLSAAHQGDRLLNICREYLNFCEEEFAVTGNFPNISPFQHRGNDKAEGQMHINNLNLRWHIEESGFFCGWLSYRDLYQLLEPNV